MKNRGSVHVLLLLFSLLSLLFVYSCGSKSGGGQSGIRVNGDGSIEGGTSNVEGQGGGEKLKDCNVGWEMLLESKREKRVLKYSVTKVITVNESIIERKEYDESVRVLSVTNNSYALERVGKSGIFDELYLKDQFLDDCQKMVQAKIPIESYHETMMLGQNKEFREESVAVPYGTLKTYFSINKQDGSMLPEVESVGGEEELQKIDYFLSLWIAKGETPFLMVKMIHQTVMEFRYGKVKKITLIKELKDFQQ